MAKELDEAKELVRQMIRERVADKVGVHSIVYHGEEIIVSKSCNGQTSFKLPRLNKFYTVLSGRIYERALDRKEADPEAGNAPSGIDVQQDYQGNPEMVDTAIFNNRIVCACSNIRYVKKADMFQVKKCKPCTIRERKERRRMARKKVV